MNHLIAICVGHSRQINGRPEGGAVSVGGVREWDFNCNLAHHIGEHLNRYRIPRFIIDRYQGNGYGAAQRWLAANIKERGATAAIELHFNSAGPTARGHEWLHWHSSTKSQALANSIDLEMRMQFAPALLPTRGVKALTGADRGAEFGRGTHCPAVICEPFFGSNDDDWSLAQGGLDKIAVAIANGILEWIG